MNDITKARYFLRHNRSDLQHLESFGLMYATAENRYREIRLQARSQKGDISLADKELNAAADYVVLRYLKKYNTLPSNLPDLFKSDVDNDRKRELLEGWIYG